jgi:hypothetical protein
MRTNAESGILADQQVDFYKNYVFRAIKDAGRPVFLDLRAWIVAGGMIKAAEEVGVPVRLSTKYWAEDMGRPYQPAETYPNYSYLGFWSIRAATSSTGRFGRWVPIVCCCGVIPNTFGERSARLSWAARRDSRSIRRSRRRVLEIGQGRGAFSRLPNRTTFSGNTSSSATGCSIDVGPP